MNQKFSFSTKVLMLVAVIVLTGCAGTPPGRLMKREPTIELSSSRPSKEIIGCISDRWPTSLLIHGITEKGYTVGIKSDEYWVIAFVKAEEKDARTNVKFWQSSEFVVSAEVRQAVIDCK